GGVGALEATLALRELAAERVAVMVVAPDREFVYRPLAVAEPFRVGEVRRFPLEALVRDAGARFHQAAIASVDPDLRAVRTENEDHLSYDVLLLALGARSRATIPGALTFAGAH